MGQTLSNKNVQMAHVVNLISIACVDGNLADEEKQLLFQISNDMGLTEEEFNQCVEISKRAGGKVIYEAPESDEQKVNLLKNVALMMMIDGVIDEKEREYLRVLADRFGYDGNKAVDILIKNITDEVQQGLNNSNSNSTRPGGGSNTRQGDEEMSEEEYQKEIQRRIEAGKEALLKHDIKEAFDYLALPGMVNARAARLLLMIANHYHRMRLITEEQLKKNQVEDFAERGYYIAQYIMGRYHQNVKPDEDSIEKAMKWYDAAIKTGMGDAYAAKAMMILDGYCGRVDIAKYHSMIEEGMDKGYSNNYCSFALYRFLRELIYGYNGTTPNPQGVIDAIKQSLNGNESDDIEVVDPAYYVLLGYAYEALGDKKNAGEYYLKAMDMGYYETITDYMLLEVPDENSTPGVWQAWRTLRDKALQYEVPRTFVMAAQLFEKDYDDLSDKEKKERTDEIMRYLQKAVDLGYELAHYVIGSYYYFGMYGFEEDDDKAWKWFSRGAYLEDGSCYSMLAQMIEEGHAPDQYDQSWADDFRLQGLRRGDDDQLKKVVEIYRAGRLTNFAGEIEMYYIPRYEQQIAEGGEEGEGPEGNGEDGDYKLIAIIKTDGKADIIEFDVENWDELPAFVDANRLDAIRVQPLYDIGNRLGFEEHITGWVDNMGLMKNLPRNPIGCQIYPGPIAGDMILTLEDQKYNPMSFTNLTDLKNVVSALGAKLDHVYLDDGPDDDGRFDAWS